MNTPASSSLLAACTIVIGSSLAISASGQSSAPSDSTKVNAAQLEAFEVLGSRIKRTEAEGTLPVATYTADEIDARGFNSFADFVQSLPFNTGGADTINNTNNAARGATLLNPRGLGTSRFLVLVNGRRAVSYPLTDGFNRSVFDFNSIPSEAIERVEYLKDGASAIYGSDAVSGVMNVKLKQNFRGLTTSVSVGNTAGRDRTDALSLSAGVLAGASSAKSSVLMSLTWSKNHDTFVQDFERSHTADYTFLGTNKGANLNTVAHDPPNLTLTAAQATSAGLAGGAGVYALTGGVRNANPTKAAFTRFASAGDLPNANRTELAERTQLTPRRENWNVYLHGERVLTPAITIYGDLLYARALTGQSRPPSSFSSAGTILPSGSNLVIPASNPYNPFGIALNNFTWDSSFGPRRIIDIRSESNGILAGLKVKLPGDWTLDTALNFSGGRATTLLRNLARAASLQTVLNGATRQTALNPFGPSENQALVDGLWVYARNDAYLTDWLADVTANGRIATLPAWFGQRAGRVSAALGAEWRNDRLENRPDTVSYVGLGGGSPYTGNRTVVSQFAELETVVVPRYLELQLAGRHEYYSDFGHTTRPKLAFSSEPVVWLKVRGSYSQSVKAPALGELFNTRRSGFTASATDPLRPGDPARAFIIVTGGNPNLQPEKGRTTFGGIVIDAGKIAKGFSLSVDYFEIAINGAITTYNTPSTLFTYFPERVIRDNSEGTPGPVLYLEGTPNNVASYRYKGFDLAANYDLPWRAYGRWRLGAQASRIVSYGNNFGITSGFTELAGRSRYPRWSGNAQLAWNVKKVGATLSAVYTGAFFNDVYTTTGWGENPIAKINLSATYFGFKRMRFTLSCDNVLDTRPHVNGRAVQGFDISTNSGYTLGRFVTLRARRDF